MSVARKVLENTQHSFLVGDLATEFAKQMGFEEENLTSNWSKNAQEEWKKEKCQPNFWRNVSPDPTSNCGPYKPTKGIPLSNQINNVNKIDPDNHDTIGMVAIDKEGKLAVGTSTNGLRHKIPGYNLTLMYCFVFRILNCFAISQ